MLLCLIFSASLLHLFRSNFWWAGGHLRLFHITVLCVLLHRIYSDQIFVPDLFWIAVLPLTNNQPKTSNEFYLFYCSDQILRVACFWCHYIYTSYQNQTFVPIKFLEWHAFGVITFTPLIKIRHLLNKQFICSTTSYCKVVWGSSWLRSPSCFFFLLSLTVPLPCLPHSHSKNTQKKTPIAVPNLKSLGLFPLFTWTHKRNWPKCTVLKQSCYRPIKYAVCRHVCVHFSAQKVYELGS